MFTNKEINTLTAMFFAASRSSSPDPVQYYREFTDALDVYFLCYPNDDTNDDVYDADDFPTEYEE